MKTESPEKRLNYVFFSYDGGIFPVADHLQREGNKVYVCQISNPNDIGMDTWINASDFEKKLETKKRRMSLYDGILKKYSLSEMMTALGKVKDKENYFVIFDHNTLCKISEQVLAMGFEKGIFPLTEDFEREDDRDAAKEFVKQHYPMIRLKETKEFTKVDELLKFIKESNEIWVVKSDGNFVETIVPDKDDIEMAKKQIETALTDEGKDAEKGKLIVEKKIKDPIEFTPQMAFWNGEYLYSQVEIETRMFGAEDIGPQTGGNLNVVIRTYENDKINQICFPRAAKDLMKGRKGLTFLDAGILSDGENLFFTEFAGCRWGWGGIFSEMSASESGKLMCTNYFEAVARCEEPYAYEVGSSVALYNIKPDSDVARMPKDGMQIIMKDGFENNFFITQLRKEKDGYVNVGYRWYDDGPMGYAVGRGDTIEEAAETAYDVIQGISMKGLINRPKSDFLNPDYPSAIMKRYNFLVENKLITRL